MRYIIQNINRTLHCCVKCTDKLYSVNKYFILPFRIVSAHILQFFPFFYYIYCILTHTGIQTCFQLELCKSLIHSQTHTVQLLFIDSRFSEVLLFLFSISKIASAVWWVVGWSGGILEIRYCHFILAATIDYLSSSSPFYVAVQLVSGLQKAVPVLSQSVCTATSSPEHVTVTVLVLKWSYTVTVSNRFFHK